MIREAFNKMAKQIVKPATEENVYIPNRVTHGDIKRHWESNRGSYNVELINRISEIKANQ